MADFVSGGRKMKNGKKYEFLESSILDKMQNSAFLQKLSQLLSCDFSPIGDKCTKAGIKKIIKVRQYILKIINFFEIFFVVFGF